MFEGLFQPLHLLLFVVAIAAALGGLWLVVRIISNAWHRH